MHTTYAQFTDLLLAPLFFRDDCDRPMVDFPPIVSFIADVGFFIDEF